MDAAWDCRKHDLTPEQAISEIRATEGMLRDGRRFQHSEVEGSVEKVYACEGLERKGITAKETWPKWKPDRTREIHERAGLETYDLWEESPERVEEQTTEDFIDALFGDANPLLCCGWSMSKFSTMRRNDWRGRLSGMQLVVPAIMSAPTGTTKCGKVSAHTIANTGARIYAVVDLDDPPPEEHASILWHLAEFAPMAIALRSGGKGLHGWFRMPDLLRVREFYRYACVYGADPVLYRNSSQFVRMPHGLRDNGNRQSVVYFNPRNCLGYE